MRFALLGSRGFPSTYGGYETLVRELAPHLVRLGHDVTVYCRTRDEGRRVWVNQQVHCIATSGLDSKSLSTLSFGLTSSVNAFFNQYDAALVVNIANGFWLPIIGRAGTPTLVNTDGLEWERGKWSGLGKSVFKTGAQLSARWADGLVADSEEIRRIWRERFGRNSVFIPYGAHELRNPTSHRVVELGLVPGSYALAVARLAPENNVELTLDAIEGLGDQAPPMVVVGTANSASPIESRLKDMQRAGKVTWLGHVSDQALLADLWHNSGVYVHGHSVGGTNPALLQALGASAPTIALDTPFNREVLGPDGTVYRHDAVELGGRILELTSNGRRRAEAAARGLATVRERYTWEAVCDAYAAELVRLAEERGPTSRTG